MLLCYLTHSFEIRRDRGAGADDLRPAVISRIFGEMYNLKAIAGILVRLPLVSPKDPRRAGPTFQTPFTLVLPSSEVDVWRMHRDLVRGSRELVSTLMQPGSTRRGTPLPDGQQYLSVLRDLDGQNLAFIDQVLIGLQPMVRRAR
jgi:hypothetical protein